MVVLQSVAASVDVRQEIPGAVQVLRAGGGQDGPVDVPGGGLESARAHPSHSGAPQQLSLAPQGHAVPAGCGRDAGRHGRLRRPAEHDVGQIDGGAGRIDAGRVRCEAERQVHAGFTVSEDRHHRRRLRRFLVQCAGGRRVAHRPGAGGPRPCLQVLTFAVEILLPCNEQFSSLAGTARGGGIAP